MAGQSKSHSLNLEIIQQGLTTQALGRRGHLVNDVSSTNTLAITLAESGEPHGTIILADTQTAGRGRLGRSWVSCPHKNIYCSAIFIDPRLCQYITWIPLMTGLAISEALRQEPSITLSLKWPNDILVENKKLGGILCETTNRTKNPGVIVVGFGVNVNAQSEDFPAALRTAATSLSLETGKVSDRNSILTSILNHLEKWYDHLAANKIEDMHLAYSSNCSTLGLDVRCVLTTTQEIHGRAIGIAKDGALQVMPYEPGRKTVEIRSADVTHVREQRLLC